MKGKLSILVLMITILSIVFHNLIPHHHHGDKICMHMEFSDIDCSSEHHSEQNSEEKDNKCDKNCSLNSNYLIKITDNQNEIINIESLIPVCDILINYISLIPLQEVLPDYNSVYLFSYQSVLYKNGLTLRAPPTV